MEVTKLLTNEKALELAEKLLQNDKKIRDELRNEKADLTYVDEKINKTKTSIENTNTSLNENITILKNEIDTNKSASDTSISDLDTKINNINSEINEKIVNINTEINETIVSVKSETDEKIVGVKSEINEIINVNKTETDTYITNINTSISALNAELEENINALFDAINTETNRVNSELSNLDETDNALSDRVSIVEDDYVKHIELPKNISELMNDSNYQTALDVNDTLATALLPYAKSADVTIQIDEEIAKVVAEAPESFDTLKELASWIANHETDATAMNSAIQDNKSNIVILEDNKVDKIEGMGLSSNDYTTDEKIKLEGLSNYDDSVLTSKITSLETEMSDLKSNIASVDEINDYLFGEEE